MKRYFTKMTPGYLALKLGRGVTPVGVYQIEDKQIERPYASLTVQIEKTPTRLFCSWQHGKGMKWHAAS